VILPWNDPLRVAERMILLDHLSDGRAVFGMARGLAKREYVGFRQNMEDSRERFDEAARMICKAIEEGSIEGTGKYFPQPKTPIRPRPLKSFAGRRYMVAMSPDTVPICAKSVRCNVCLPSSRGRKYSQPSRGIAHFMRPFITRLHHPC